MQNAMLTMVLICALAALLSGCRKSESPAKTEATPAATSAPPRVRDDHENDHKAAVGQDHAHDEVSLGTVVLGEMEVELAQGHGKVEAGKEGHLIVKLPYNDKGQTIVRVWLGTEDRTMSLVSKAEYAQSHDDYDVHALAPDLLPNNLMWWIEIERPDGTKVAGAAKPLVD